MASNAERDFDSPESAHITQAPGVPPIRQNTAPFKPPAPSRPLRNARNLTLPAPLSPSASGSSTTTIQGYQYQSLAEGVANISTYSPLIVSSSSRPDTPSAFARPVTPATPSLPPRTPLISRTPLTPALTLPESITSPSTAKPSAKGKLKSLLPRSHHEAHSYFHAKIEIEQLASVPFVRGEFGVRWKLKGSVGMGGVKNTGVHHEEGREDPGGLIGKMKARSNKGKAKDDSQGASEFGLNHAHANASSPSLISEGTHSNSINSYSSYSSGDSYSTSRSNSIATSASSSTSIVTSTTGKTAVPPFNGKTTGSIFTRHADSSSPTGYGVNQYLFSNAPASSKAYEESLLFSPNQQAFSSNAANPTSPGMEGMMSPGLAALSPTGTITQANASSHPQGFGSFALGANLTPSRGLTPYLPLKDHSITFNFPLNAILKFDIARGTSNQQVEGNPKPNLMPNEFKLVVMQRVIPDDPDGIPQNPRLGAVYLNLAEYVGKGRVGRRYLLKESRVNATLRLSIEMTYVSGNTDYVAPPLPKAEIMGDIEGFLAQSDTFYKKPAKEIFGYTYGPYKDKEELEVDLLGKAPGSDGLEDAATDDDRRYRSDSSTPYRFPYALPSESESDLDEHHANETDRARRHFLRALTLPVAVPPPPIPSTTISVFQSPSEDKEAERRKRRELRREERRRQFALELDINPYALPPMSGDSESEVEADEESDAGAFESAPEEDGKGDPKPGMVNANGDGGAQSGSTASQPINRQERPRKLKPKKQPPTLNEIAGFDVQRLPLAYGPKTTEVLIDALFNPLIVTNRRFENPFTYYIDPQEYAAMTPDERMLLQMQPGRQKIKNALVGMGMLSSPDSAPKRMGGRSFSRDTMSTGTTTTSESGGSPGNGEMGLGNLKSPGEATIVGVPPPQVGLGLGIEGAFGVPMDRDQDATIGRHAEKSGGGGVGSKFQQYYRNRKSRMKKTKSRRSDTGASTAASNTSASASEDNHGVNPATYTTAMKSQRKSTEPSMNVLGSPVFVQEPQGMSSEDQPGFSRHRRTDTRSTMDSALSSVRTNNSSSVSLSSLSLSSRSGHGHGQGGAGPVVPPVPPLIPGSMSVAAASAASSSSDKAGKLPSVSPLGIPHRTLARQSTSPSNDLSVPDGRMDKTGFVKGHPAAPPAVATTGFGSSLNRWWRGLGGHGHSNAANVDLKLAPVPVGTSGKAT